MVFIVQTDISVGRELILFTKSTYFTYRSCGQGPLSEGSKIGLTETRSDQIWAQEEITLSEGISQPSIQFVKTPSSLPPPEILSDIFC